MNLILQCILPRILQRILQRNLRQICGRILRGYEQKRGDRKAETRLSWRCRAKHFDNSLPKRLLLRDSEAIVQMLCDDFFKQLQCLDDTNDTYYITIYYFLNDKVSR